jgi:phosphatidylserine synthase
MHPSRAPGVNPMLLSRGLRYVSPVAGFILAYLGVVSIYDQAWEALYGYLGLALLIQILDAYLSADEIDPAHARATGPGALATEAAQLATSVFVPTMALLHAGFLEDASGGVLAVLIVASALYRLAFHPAHESTEPAVVCLPALWSVVAFLLHAFDATPLAAVFVIGCVLILTLVPIRWPHPLYAERWPVATRLVLAAGVMAAAVTLTHGLPADTAAKTVFIGCLVYTMAWAASDWMEHRA